MVEPSKIMFLIENTIPQKEDTILLYNGYHSIPKESTTQMKVLFQHMGRWRGWGFPSLRGVGDLRI